MSEVKKTKIEIIAEAIFEFQESGRASSTAMARFILWKLYDSGYRVISNLEQCETLSNMLSREELKDYKLFIKSIEMDNLRKQLRERL